MQEEKIKSFIQKLQQLYLIERNIEEVLKLLDDSITWVGTGKSEVVNSREEARQFLEEEKRRFPAGFQILESDYQVQAISQSVCVARGILTVQEAGREDVFESLSLRVSIVCVEKEEEIRATHIHMSSPSRDQLDKEFFPRILSGEDTHMLRKLLDEQSMELRHINKNLSTLIGNIPGSVMCCECTEEMELIQYSDRFMQMLGYTKEEIKERFDNKFSNMIHHEDLEKTRASVRRQLEQGNSKEVEYRLVRKDGSIIRILDQGKLAERDGRNVFYCILTDITEKRETMEALRLSLERHEIIMTQTTDIIFEWDLDKDTLQFSENWHDKFGYEPVKEKISTSIAESEHIPEEDIPVLMQMIQSLKVHTRFADDCIRIKKADGTPIWCRVRVTLQVDENSTPRKAIGVIVDVDKETKQTQQLRERAEKDELTGLYNKGTIERIAVQSIMNATQERSCAFMIIDIDDFKIINDTFGHLKGDEILKKMADSLKQFFGSTDSIGRIGGDEFAVVFHSVTEEADVTLKAREIGTVFNQLLSAEEYCVSCSMGIAFAPEHGANFSTIYQNADLALYAAKAAGKNAYMVYSEEMSRFNA